MFGNEGDWVSQVYNIDNGIDLYMAQRHRFLLESTIPEPQDIYPLLVRQCAPAAAAKGLSLEQLTSMTIDIIDVLSSHACVNRGHENIVHFIHGMLVANLGMGL